MVVVIHCCCVFDVVTVWVANVCVVSNRVVVGDVHVVSVDAIGRLEHSSPADVYNTAIC